MLLLYFLRHFYKNFAIFFGILLFVFAASDLLMRLPTLPSVAFIPAIFWCMIPLVAQFAIPVASCLAVQATVGHLYVTSSILMLRFLRPLRTILHSAVVIFSISILIPYVVLVFDWAPGNYAKAKRLLVSFAQEHLSKLAPGKFHYPTSNFVLFFKDKKIKASQNGKQVVTFFDVLLMFQHEEGQRQIITAKEGFLHSGLLCLKHGMLQYRNAQKQYVATFDTTTLDLDRLVEPRRLGKDISSSDDVQTKFLTWRDLLLLKKHNKKAWTEFHGRILKVVWQLLFPFLALVVLVLWGHVQRSNLLLCIGGSGCLFLCSFMSIGFGQALWSNSMYALSVMYGVCCFVTVMLTFLYRKKW